MGVTDVEGALGDSRGTDQLNDLRRQINELRDFLEVHLSRHTELLESLQEPHGGESMGQIEAELPPEPELAEGEGEVKQPPQEHQETDKRTSFADRQAMLWSGSVVGRSSLVSASIFHFKARAHMQSLKLRASKRNPAQSSQEFGWQSLVRDLVFSSLFSAIITVLILVNVILLGVEVDLYASLDVNQEVPSWYGTANAIIVGIFVLEIGLKIFALGCRDFWRGRDSAWNVLDFTIVFISVLDVVLQLLSSTLDTGIASLVRAIRIARAVRGIRLIRIFRYITALRTLALSIISTLGSLFWTMALFMLMFYFFAIVLTQLVADNCRFLKMDGDSLGTGPLCREILPKYWASVPESMLTLFMAITNGVSWDETIRPLREVSKVAIIFVVAYVALAVFAILNVVTGVFCNTAIESAHADKEVATIKQVNSKDQQLDSLRSVFREIDSRCTNEVSFEDVEEAISKGELGSFMEAMGVSTDDVWTLCMLLDSDKNGRIDLEEFVSGCMQLHGPAKSLQLAKMSFENKLTRRAIKQLTEEMAALKRSLMRSRVSAAPAREAF